jgi:hypothetical protein
MLERQRSREHAHEHPHARTVGGADEIDRFAIFAPDPDAFEGRSRGRRPFC